MPLTDIFLGRLGFGFVDHGRVRKIAKIRDGKLREDPRQHKAEFEPWTQVSIRDLFQVADCVVSFFGQPGNPLFSLQKSPAKWRCISFRHVLIDIESITFRQYLFYNTRWLISW